MTTVILDFKKQTIYADCRTTTDYNNVPLSNVDNVKKILPVGKGTFLVGVGDFSVIDIVKRNYPEEVLKGYSKEKPNARFIVVHPSKLGMRVKYFEFSYIKNQRSLYEILIEDIPKYCWSPKLIKEFTQTEGYFTLGSGEVLARAFLDLGYSVADTFEKVEVYDPYTTSKYTKQEVKY